MIKNFLSSTLLVLLACASLSAQSNTGRILGAVTDQSGGAVSGAMVTVTNTQTGVPRNLVTDQSGEYSAPNLLPGVYTVRATSTGFKTAEQANIQLETGRDLRIDFQLAPGEVSQTVEVTAAAPLIDMSSSTVGGTISNETINDLPLNGRNYLNLVILRPGVVITPGGGSLTQTSNGLRPETMNYFVDGLDNNEGFKGTPIVNGTLPSGDAATILPIDAIQEFNVEVNPPAEFGRKPGAVVNVGIKSGTNTIHGTAYAFGRDHSWDARDVFNQAPATVAPGQLEQFGGTMGGPIKKDKLFYFGGYEEQRYTIGAVEGGLIPTTSSVGGTTGPSVSIPDATAALNANCASLPTTTPAYCSGGAFVPNTLSQKLLQYFGPNSGSGSSIPIILPNTARIDNFIGKVNYNLDNHNSINGSYFLGNGNSTSDDGTYTLPQFESLAHLRTQFVTTNWTWTPNSKWVNEVRFGFTYLNQLVNPGDQSINYGINTGVTNPVLGGLPVIAVAGFTQLGGSVQWPNIRGPNWTYDAIDQVSYLRGRHAIKFGGEMLKSIVNGGTYSRGRGRFAFNGGKNLGGSSTSLEDFLAGSPSLALLLVGSPIVNDLKQWTYAGFIQDDWRATSKITVNMGLRYEYTTPMSEPSNLLGNWSPSSGLLQAGVNTKTAYNGYHRNFGPRLGIAWDITGKGTTVVRAGGGLFFDDMPVSAWINDVATANASTLGLNVIPTGSTLYAPNGSTSGPVGSIQATAFTITGNNLNWTLAGPIFSPAATSTSKFQCGNGLGSNPAPCNLLAMDQHFKNPYVGTWTINVQHQFSSTLSLQVAYVANHGGNLSSVIDMNQLNPQSPAEIACGHCEAITDRPFYNQFPYLKFINFMGNLYRSNYNGLQTTLTARDFHRMTTVVGYTYSHALDDASHNFNEGLAQDSTNPQAEYGSSDFDLRHHFTISWNYNVPEKKMWGQFLEGWQLNSIFLVQNGFPWSAVDSTSDVSKTGELTDRWDFFGNPSDFKSGPTAIPYFPGVSNTACAAQAAAMGSTASLTNLGCYAKGSSFLLPPAFGTFGTASRNIFQASRFLAWDASVFKTWKIRERLSAQFRVEIFNLLNHPTFADPSQIGNTNPGTKGGNFGCGCETPDVGANNPLLGSGSNRAMQLGLKFLF